MGLSARDGRGRLILLLTAGGRSGSHMLCGMLDSHSDVRCEHELIDDDTPSWREAGLALGGNVNVIHAHWRHVRLEMLDQDDVPIMALIRLGWATDPKTKQQLTARYQWPHTERHYDAAVRTREAITDKLIKRAGLVLDYDAITNGGCEITELGGPYRQAVCGFLGVPVAPMRTTARKRNPHG